VWGKNSGICDKLHTSYETLSCNYNYNCDYNYHGIRFYSIIFNAFMINYNYHGIHFLTQYCAGDKIEKNGMGGACSADEGERHV
jgi:hypothetical protein